MKAETLAWVLTILACCSSARGQQKSTESLQRLELTIARARGLSFDDDPAHAAAQIRQLVGIRALLADALVYPGASHRLLEILADPKRSRGERVLAGYAVFEARAGVDSTRPDAQELLKRLNQAYRAGIQDRLLRWPVVDVLLRTNLIDRRRRLTEAMRAGPWLPSHPVDVEMVRELLERLPSSPRKAFSGLEYPPRWYMRIYEFLDVSRISVDAVEYMMRRYPEAKADLQSFLFGHVASWVGHRLDGQQPVPQALRDWTFSQAAELVKSGDPGRGAETALGLLMDHEFGAEHARLMVEAARKATDPRWRKNLQDVIRGYIERGEWPKGVSVDGVFSGKPPVAPRTTPRWRKRPEQMIIDEHPLLKHFPELRPHLKKRQGQAK